MNSDTVASPLDRTTAESRAEARAEARRVHRARRQEVTRSAEAVAPTAALLALGLGLLLRNAGSGAVAGAGAGLLVSAIGLDLYARGLGAWTMRSKPPVAIILAVLGSPFVLLHALLARRGPLALEPGGMAFLLPVAGIVALFAAASS